MTTTLQAGVGWCWSWQQWQAARPTARLYPRGKPTCEFRGLMLVCVHTDFLFLVQVRWQQLNIKDIQTPKNFKNQSVSYATFLATETIHTSGFGSLLNAFLWLRNKSQIHWSTSPFSSALTSCSPQCKRCIIKEIIVQETPGRYSCLLFYRELDEHITHEHMWLGKRGY